MRQPNAGSQCRAAMSNQAKAEATNAEKRIKHCCHDTVFPCRRAMLQPPIVTPLLAKHTPTYSPGAQHHGPTALALHHHVNAVEGPLLHSMDSRVEGSTVAHSTAGGCPRVPLLHERMCYPPTPPHANPTPQLLAQLTTSDPDCATTSTLLWGRRLNSAAARAHPSPATQVV